MVILYISSYALFALINRKVKKQYTVNDRLNTLGVYSRGAFISKCTNLENKNELLVGHVPIELSRLKLAWWYLENMLLGASLGKWRECYTGSEREIQLF